MTVPPTNGSLKADDIDRVTSEACTRSGAFALLVSVLLLVLCISLQGRKADEALAVYISNRLNLALFIEELQKNQIWNKYAESHSDYDQKPLAQLIHAKVELSPSQKTIPQPTEKQSRSSESRSPKTSNWVPSPPGNVNASFFEDMGELSEMSQIVQSWQKLNDSNLLARSRESSNYFDLSITKWATRRSNLMYANILSGACTAPALEVPRRELVKLERYVPRLNDEALMNCINIRDLKELAQFELPQMSVPTQLGTKIARDVDLSPGSLPKDPYAASLVAEALLFFALVYFSAFAREAVTSDSFPARGTLFGAFSGTRGVLAVFFVALWAPFLACCAIGFTSEKVLLGLAAVPVFFATFSAHQTLAGRSFFESIRPSALLADYNLRSAKAKVVDREAISNSKLPEPPPDSR